ncbi:MAG TPA: hypothetical protein VKZ51_06515, partial [Cyclobacteriaceae bacterium]|nr:hypothetical protein [Cyclobacteriaceae bacterium]
FGLYPELNFEPPDLKTFRNLQLAYDALDMGGNAACLLNAANEVVVAAFLQDQVGFLEIPEIINETLHTAHFVKQPSLEDFIASDREARILTKQKINKNKNREWIH